MARTDYGAILSTVIKDTSDAVREVNGTSSLIAPNQWGTAIRTMHSDSDYDNVMAQLIEEIATGDIASFSDGANNIPCPSVLCTINPVQDLHGQDYPYPSGGGKNKYPTATESGTQRIRKAFSLSAGTYTISALCTSSDTDANTCAVIFQHTDDTFGTLYQLDRNTRSSVVITLAKDAKEINFYASADNAKGAGDTFTFSNIQVESGSTATSYAPYSNICPITGHTELNLVHTGKNLLPFKNGIDFTINGVRFYTSNGNLYLDGTANASISSLSQDFIDNFKFYLPEGTYHFERNNDGYFSMYIKPIGVDANIIANSGTAILTSGTNAYLGMYIVSGKTFSNTLIPCQLELGSSATTYEPYTGTTTTTDFGTTVYGGNLDTVSGVLTIDRAIVDLSTLYWSTPTNRANTSDLRGIIKAPTSVALKSGVIAEKYYEVPATTSLSVEGQFAVGTDGTMYFYRNVDTPTGNLVYPLATPTTTQLTPQEVKSLLGSNNFYHDCNGQVAVTYKANGELYVAQHT